MGENRAGWTMHRISWERRGHQDADCYSPWSDQRRAFADNRRARLRQKRAARAVFAKGYVNQAARDWTAWMEGVRP